MPVSRRRSRCSDDGPEGDGFDFVHAGRVRVRCKTTGRCPLTRGGNIFEALCVADPRSPTPTTKPFSFTTVPGPVHDGGRVPGLQRRGSRSRARLLLQPVLHPHQQCDALQGCRETMKCGLDNNCTDPTTCYFASCTTVINKWANTSAATFLSAKLESCGCPTAITAATTRQDAHGKVSLAQAAQEDRPRAPARAPHLDR